MKVRVKHLDSIVEVSEARANYWQRMGYAEIIDETTNLTEKVIKEAPTKQAVKKVSPKKKATKKAKK